MNPEELLPDDEIERYLREETFDFGDLVQQVELAFTFARQITQSSKASERMRKMLGPEDVDRAKRELHTLPRSMSETRVLDLLHSGVQTYGEKRTLPSFHINMNVQRVLRDPRGQDNIQGVRADMALLLQKVVGIALLPLCERKITATGIPSGSPDIATLIQHVTTRGITILLQLELETLQ